MAGMRVELRQQQLESEIRWRLTESDGRLVHSWLPDLESDDWLPIDRGGFKEQRDALGFKLAVDLIRAEAGLISETPAQIELERLELDKDGRGRPKATPTIALRFERHANSLLPRATESERMAHAT